MNDRRTQHIPRAACTPNRSYATCEGESVAAAAFL